MCIMYNKFSPFGNCRQVNLPFILEHGYRSLEEEGGKRQGKTRKRVKAAFVAVP